MTASKLSKLTIPQLQALRDAVEQEISNKISDVKNKVTVKKVKEGTFRFEYREHNRKLKTYEAQKALNGSWKVYKMEKGSKPDTLKKGAVIDSRYLGSVNDLRSDIAFGRIGK
jgi:hypothetical protein